MKDPTGSLETQDDRRRITNNVNSMQKIIFILVLTVVSIFLMGSDTQNGRLRIALPYETQGERHWFVSSTGTGDCLSRETACTFRIAVSKCTDDQQDVIWLSPEDHDCDNGSDATGTTVTAKNVRIVGSGGRHDFASRLFNTAAAVTHVLQVTNGRFSIEGVRFTQDDQLDVDATYLTISNNRSNVILCHFKSDPASTADIGILYDSTSRFHYLEHVHIDDFQTAGIRTNDANQIEGYELHFHDNAVAMDITHADDEAYEFHNLIIKDNVTGVAIAAGAFDIGFCETIFFGNTTNIVDNGTYGGVCLQGTELGLTGTLTYPANAGVTITGNAAAWTQGNLTQIIPASTITTPFYITGFNIQSSTANNIYKLELFYGEATGDNSLGIYEFVDVAGASNPPPTSISFQSLPSNSYVGAKIASSSGGGDNAVITLNYKAL